MLVLDRKIQEGFWIDQRIFVKVLGIGRRRVKLGIEAPSDMNIMRSELAPTPAEASAAAGSREPAHSVGPSEASSELRRGRRRRRNDQRAA